MLTDSFVRQDDRLCSGILLRFGHRCNTCASSGVLEYITKRIRLVYILVVPGVSDEWTEIFMSGG